VIAGRVKAPTLEVSRQERASFRHRHLIWPASTTPFLKLSFGVGRKPAAIFSPPRLKPTPPAGIPSVPGGAKVLL
jgi:hypothetical protein